MEVYFECMARRCKYQHASSKNVTNLICGQLIRFGRNLYMSRHFISCLLVFQSLS